MTNPVAEPVSAETLTNVEKLRGLPWSIAFEAANTVFVQFIFWGAPFVLFLNELAFSNSQIGFLYSIFPYFGLLALFIAPAIARRGYKQTYLRFYGARKVTVLPLLLVPWLHLRYDGRFTFIAIITTVMLFAFCRAVAETAIYPWIQEYIPDSVRGKYSATSNIVTRIVGVISVAISGFIVDSSTSLNRFTILIGIGAAFGFLAVGFVSQVPGGAAVPDDGSKRKGLKQTLSVLKDANFRAYLFGLGAVTIAISPMSAFVPLFMRREVGLLEGQVILLQTGVLIGGLVSTFFWGWMADRYGSKPIMISSLYLLLVLLAGWLLMPRGAVAFYVAFGLACLQGLTMMGWVIGAGRLLFVRVVPPDNKTEYLAVYYAVLGLFAGSSQLLNGLLVDLTRNIEGTIGMISVNPYTPLFAGSFVLTIISILLFNRVSADNDFSVGQFVGMLVRGNPFSALTSVARYYRAKDEDMSIAATEKLGKTKSPLAVDELLDALRDPRFNVRFEAIIAMARMNPDARIINALEGIVNGTELALTAPAIWALGRIGSSDAIDTLTKALDADYRSIRAHAARALGSLGHLDEADTMLRRLESEANPGLNMAYASALGKLEWIPAIPAILNLLNSAENTGARLELALSLARIVGNEGHFIQLLRKERADMGTASAQALIPLRKQFTGTPGLLTLLNETIETFAAQSLDEGAVKLADFIENLPYKQIHEQYQPILDACMESLSAEGVTHPEFVVLAVHVLVVA